jgi:hypothetical protein
MGIISEGRWQELGLLLFEMLCCFMLCSSQEPETLSMAFAWYFSYDNDIYLNRRIIKRASLNFVCSI